MNVNQIKIIVIRPVKIIFLRERMIMSIRPVSYNMVGSVIIFSIIHEVFLEQTFWY